MGKESHPLRYGDSGHESRYPPPPQGERHVMAGVDPSIADAEGAMTSA